MTSVFSISLRSVVVYLFMVACTRLFGKRELSQLSVVDLVLILLISNSVQNAMVGPDSSLLGGIVAAGTLFVVDYVLKLILDRFPNLGRAVEGEPLVLVYNGKVNKANMNKAKLDMSELTEALRQHGIIKMDDVKLAILEVDGEISVIPNEEAGKN